MSLPLDAFSVGFSAAKDVQWRALLKRSDIEHAPGAFGEVVNVIKGFVEPVLASVQEEKAFVGRWEPLGPWIAIDPET